MNHSFITDFTDHFEMIHALLISFIANNFLSFFLVTFQTFPKPPFPIAK